MFRFTRRGTVEYAEAGEFSTPDFVTHAFCTRREGVSGEPFSSLNTGFLVGDRKEAVQRNLALVREAFAIPEGRLILMKQVHGDRIRVLDGTGPLPEGFPECDGLITDRPGVALGIRTADCAPLFFVDRVRRVIGAAHAGWRGTALGIAGRMVDLLKERFSSRGAEMKVFIGPAIGPCCYEVDAPVFAAFSSHRGADRFLTPCPGRERWMLNLPLANRLQLAGRGVPEENILSAECCTACLPDLFFSHRTGGGRTGRQLNLLMLREGWDPKSA